LKDTVDSEIQAAKIVIMAAAVADFRTKNVAKSKIKKDESNNILELVATTDILEGILKNRQAHQFIVGFAAETGDSIEIENYAKRKFERKPVDLLVVNDVSEGKVFGSLTNKAFFLCKGSNGFETINFGEMSKDTLAEEILTFIQKRLGLNNGK
jgi:phosphopantothenoylcysteine decarboxylase/phosphopantothenate--cysteine ligase